MASSAASYPGACPHLSRPVPTRVPTSGLESWARPNRPGLFPSRTYSDCRPSFPTLHIQRSRLGHTGRLGQASNGAGFGVPTSRQTSGQSGRQASSDRLGGKARSFRLAGADVRVLPKGIPSRAIQTPFFVRVPVPNFGSVWLAGCGLVPPNAISIASMSEYATHAHAHIAPSHGGGHMARGLHAARSAGPKGDAACDAVHIYSPGLPA